MMKEGSRIKSVGNQEKALGCGSGIDLCFGNDQDSWLGTEARAGSFPLVNHSPISSTFTHPRLNIFRRFSIILVVHRLRNHWVVVLVMEAQMCLLRTHS